MIIINPSKPFYIDKHHKVIRMGNFADTGKEIEFNNEILITLFQKLINPIEKNELIDILEKESSFTKEEIQNTIDYLISENFIINYEEYSNVINENLYNRQNLFFSMFTNDFKHYTNNFADKKILVLGLGGIGSITALMLSRAGFKQFILVDCDNVEESNLIRQYPYTIEDIGLLKVNALSAKMPNANITKKNTKVLEAKDIQDEVFQSDLVLCTLDKPSRIIRNLINDLCVKYNKPVLFCGFSEHMAMVGPFIIPKKSACLACNEKKSQEIPLNNVLVVPSYGPICGFISSLATNEIINYFINYTEFNLVGKTLMFNMANYNCKIKKWKKNENCEVCSK